LCCGRPLYDYGFLDKAQRWLEEILVALKPEIQAGVPMVVLEPSCCAVFRDELLNLFPNNEDAKKLHSQTFVLSEFINQRAPHYKINQLDREALVQLHCHQRSVIGIKDEEAVMKKLGLEVQIPEQSCCGMAGAFGFEQGEHYEVSIKCGEKDLLPAVRKASRETLIIADGFSCHEQIVQRTDAQPLHLAQVLQKAIHEGHPPPPEPETRKAEREATHAEKDHTHAHELEEGEHHLHNRLHRWIESAESWWHKHRRH